MSQFLFILLVLIFPITDISSALIYSATGTELSGYFRLVRDIITIYLASKCIITNRPPKELLYPFYLYLFLVTLHCGISVYQGLSIGLIFSSSGTLLLPFLIVFAAIEGIRTGVDFNRAYIALSCYALISSVFGVWETQNTDFWIYDVELGEYLRDVKGIQTGFNPSTGLPWNFTGYEEKRRAAGILAAPLANGFFIASIGILAPFFYTKNYRTLGLLVTITCLIGLQLTETRGAYIVTMIAIFVLVFGSAKSPSTLARYSVLLSALLLLAWNKISETFHYSINLLDGSTIGHINALLTNIDEISDVLLLGHGVGSAGSQAAAKGDEIAGGGEGAIFSIAFQLGVPAAITFLFFYYSLLKLLLSYRSRNKLYIATFAVMLGATSSLIISEHILTYSGMAACWIITGGLITFGNQLSLDSSQLEKHQNANFTRI